MVGAAVEVRIRTLEHRPEEYRRAPTFFIHSLEIPAERVRENSVGDGVVEYTFRAEKSELPEDGGDLLEIRSFPWLPSGPSGNGDARKLGIMIDTVDVVPLEGPSGG